jgi:hypothetical protein
MPVIPGTWEVEVGGSWSEVDPGKVSIRLSEKQKDGGYSLNSGVLA